MKINPECIFRRTQKSELLTICIPTYHRHEDLAFCLDKLLIDYRENPLFDILVFDNGSPDKTLRVLKDRQSDLPSMSVYAWPLNTGSVFNTQHLSSFVDTKYMLWLTDDDYLSNGSIEKILSELYTFEQQDLYWIFSPIETYNLDGSILCTVSPKLLNSQPIPASASHYAKYAWAFSRQIWKTEHLRACQDHINASFFLSNSGYWMIYPAVLAISASKAFFWNESLVFHVFGNVVHWDEFGKEGLQRDARLSLDFIVTYLLGVIHCLRSRVSVSTIYSQLLEFVNIASSQKLYRIGRLATINLRQSMHLVAYQTTCGRQILAIGVLIVLVLGYLLLLSNLVLRRFVIRLAP